MLALHQVFVSPINFLPNYEIIWLNEYTVEFKSVYLKRYEYYIPCSIDSLDYFVYF